jgi:hypothetical protein
MSTGGSIRVSAEEVRPRLGESERLSRRRSHFEWLAKVDESRRQQPGEALTRAEAVVRCKGQLGGASAARNRWGTFE